jgi:outer membrane protein assembly factor BamE (lipoprotein component of BamABCDE complex)
MVLQWVDLLAQLSVLQWVDLLVSRSDAKKGYLKVQQMVETLEPKMERKWVEMKVLL